MFASRSKVEELEEDVFELEKRINILEARLKNPWGSFYNPATWVGQSTFAVPTGSEVYDEGADYKGRRSSNDLNDMGLG